VIIYKGGIKKGDMVAITSSDPNAPIIAKVKALLKPKPLDEIRDPTQRFDSVKSVTAAAGIKIAAQGLGSALAGGMLKVIAGNEAETIEEIKKESEVHIDLAPTGVVARADAIGSIEALAYETKNAEIPLRSARIGSISRKDLVEAETAPDPINRVILAFNVSLTPDAQTELSNHDVTIISNNVVYRLIEDYQTWKEKKKIELEGAKRREIVFPGKVKILPNCTFRVSKPAIVGVRVLAGRIMNGQPLMRTDGKMIGRIKSIRTGEESLSVAKMGQEIAIAIDDATVGRQIKEEDILLIDIPEGHARELQKMELSQDEAEILQEVLAVKRKETPFWAM
jgi:translation initiation factor 5B